MRRRAARRLSVARRATATLGGVALVVSSLLLTPPSAVADRSDPTTQRAVGLADPESGRGFWKFEYTGGPQTFTVPSGVNSIVIVASGGTGRKGSHIRGASSAPGGIGATTLSSHRVAPGDVLTVWVGGEGEDDGGWGYGCGGSSGKAGPGTWDLSPGGHGGGGGGASAVTAHAPDAAADDCDPSHRPTGSSVLAVAGGGGGGGGAGSQWVDPKGQTSIDISNATRGGAGGDPAGAGEQAPPPASGGCGGCESGPNGSHGSSWDRNFPNVGTGGSGGGGGGYRGGAGGGSGGPSGTAGGGGLSYISDAATHAMHYPGSGGGDGHVTITAGHVEDFGCTGASQRVSVPDDAGLVRVVAQGGGGGGRDGATAGSGALATMSAAVAGIDAIDVWVGCQGTGDGGGFGYTSGGAKGIAHFGPSHDGVGGGGSSAVFVSDDVGVVAGGGGGTGGANSVKWAPGNGGDAGPVPQPGTRGSGVPHDSKGGCGGCERTGAGTSGGHAKAITVAGGGGGGGGGWLGGQGGHIYDGASGGGGGAGSSWTSATGAEFDTSITILPVVHDGWVALIWMNGGIATIARHGGGGQSALIDGAFPEPLKAKVVDYLGRPVPGASVLFSVSPLQGQAGAHFAGGAESVRVATDDAGVATSPTFTANSVAGDWWAVAQIDATDGDTHHAWFPLTNEKRVPTVWVDVDTSPVTLSAPIDLTAHVVVADGPAATGEILFSSDGSSQYPATVTDGVAKVTIPGGVLPVGEQKIIAQYGGDARTDAGGGWVKTHVLRNPTETTVTSSASPAAAGEPFTLTADVTGDGLPASGRTVTFTARDTTQPPDAAPDDLGTAISGADGLAVLPDVSLPEGSYLITGAYQGSTDFAPSTGHVGQVVEQADAVVRVTTTPSSTGWLDPFRVDITVESAGDTLTPTGTVHLVLPADVPAWLGCNPQLVDGAAHCDIDWELMRYFEPDKPMSVKVIYDGDAEFEPATGLAVHTVTSEATTTSVTPSATSLTAGEPVTFDVHVTGHTPHAQNFIGGQVTILDNGAPIAGLEDLDIRSAPLTTPAVTLHGAGVHRITADFTPPDGTKTVAPSTGHTQVTVTAAKTSLMLSSDGASIVADVEADGAAPVSSGAVRFTVDGFTHPLPVAVVDGVAVLADPELEPGVHTVQARYVPGSGDFTTASAHAPHVLTQPTSVLIGVGTADDGSPVARSQVLPAAPDGTLTFAVDGVTVPDCAALAVEKSTAECALGALGVGDHTVTVSYSGTQTHDASSAQSVLTIPPGAAGGDAAGDSPQQELSVTGGTIAWWAVALGALSVLGGLVVRLLSRKRRGEAPPA